MSETTHIVDNVIITEQAFQYDKFKKALTQALETDDRYAQLQYALQATMHISRERALHDIHLKLDNALS